MGFMDKAKAAAQDAAEKGKKAAAQAQEKLDETQKNFNSSQAHSQDTTAPAVEYDKHGRPIKGETIADAVEDPEPIADVAPEDTGSPAGDPLADEMPPPAPPKPPSGDGMSSGDPLAG